MDRTAETQVTSSARLELANRLFRDFYASCFWHMKPDLVVSEAMIPLIVKGLRTHGGRRAMLAAAQLVEMEEDSRSCR